VSVLPYIPIRTVDDLERLVVGTTREDDWLDFKREPYSRADQGRAECARDVAQFANAAGGVLVFGGVESTHVLSGWQAVRDPDDFIRWTHDVVNGQLAPAPIVEPRTLQAPSGEVVVVINVPPSLVLIARRQADGLEFPIRSGDSRRYMTLMEVEARLQNKERAMKLRLHQIPTEAKLRFDALLAGITDGGWRVKDVDDDAVTLTQGTLEAIIPLAYVEAVYQTKEAEHGWVVAASCTVLSGGVNVLVTKYNLPEHLRAR